MRPLPALLLLSGCAAYSRESAPSGRSDVAGLAASSLQSPVREVHLHIDIPSERFAAYQFLVRWDPAVARIGSIKPCQADGFPANPEFDPAVFTTGTTRIIASALHGLGRGDYHLLTIAFEKVAAGKTAVEVVVEGLYDDSPMPRRVEGRLKGGPWEIQFP